MIKFKTEKSTGAVFGDPLTIWVQSFCRSTLATYLEIKAQYPGEVHIVIHGKADPEFRTSFGFSSSEFDLSKIHMINPSNQQAVEFLEANASGIHVFTAYHKSNYYGRKFFNKLISIAIDKGIIFFVASEAPQNMETKWYKYLVKELYLRFVLKLILSETITKADFILSFSGEETHRLTQIGWQEAKIEPFGYYPPPLQNACDVGQSMAISCPKKSETFTLLLSGDHSPCKSPITAIKAVQRLCARGYGDRFRLLVAGRGEQTDEMTSHAAALNLPIEFVGFVELPQLIALHVAADAYVATGISEPWGIRVNDALNMGCPAIVSNGMGAVDLVRNTGCGWVFDSGDSDSLSQVIAKLIENPDHVENARSAIAKAKFILPAYQAHQVVEIIQKRFT